MINWASYQQVSAATGAKRQCFISACSTCQSEGPILQTPYHRLCCGRQNSAHSHYESTKIVAVVFNTHTHLCLLTQPAVCALSGEAGTTHLLVVVAHSVCTTARTSGTTASLIATATRAIATTSNWSLSPRLQYITFGSLALLTFWHKSLSACFFLCQSLVVLFPVHSPFIHQKQLQHTNRQFYWAKKSPITIKKAKKVPGNEIAQTRQQLHPAIIA